MGNLPVQNREEFETLDDSDFETPIVIESFEATQLSTIEEYGNAVEGAQLKSNFHRLELASIVLGAERQYTSSVFPELASRMRNSLRWIQKLAKVGRVFEGLRVYPWVEISVYIEVARAKEANEIENAQHWLDRANEEDIKLEELKKLMNPDPEGNDLDDDDAPETVKEYDNVNRSTYVNKAMLREWYAFNHAYGSCVDRPASEEDPLVLHHAKIIKSFKTDDYMRRRQGIANYPVYPIPESLHVDGANSVHVIGEDHFFDEQFGSREVALEDLVRRMSLFLNEYADAAIGAEVSHKEHRELQTENTEADENDGQDTYLVVCENPDCPREGEPFEAANKDAKTCSPACRQKMYRERKKQERLERGY